MFDNLVTEMDEIQDSHFLMTSRNAGAYEVDRVYQTLDSIVREWDDISEFPLPSSPARSVQKARPGGSSSKSGFAVRGRTGSLGGNLSDSKDWGASKHESLWDASLGSDCDVESPVKTKQEAAVNSL